MPNCQLSCVTLHYAEKGVGEPLIFLNGLSGDHLYWASQLRALGKKYRCIALDNRDVGQSSYATAAYTVRDLALDVIEFMERSRLPAAHVVGLSMGGMVAQEVTLARPEMVKSLTLVDTLARADEWFRLTLSAFEVIRRQMPDTASFFEKIMPWWVSHSFFEDSERTTWLRWLLHQNPYPQRLEGFLRQIEAMQQHDVQDRLHLIRCPVLIVIGEDDCVSPPRYSRQLAERITHARLVVLPGIGHAPPLENPQQFSALLAEYLAGQNTAQKRPA